METVWLPYGIGKGDTINDKEGNPYLVGDLCGTGANIRYVTPINSTPITMSN